MKHDSTAVQPPAYLGGTVQNACTMIRDPADGKIRHFFRKGSWDTGFSSILYSVEYTGARSGAIWNREREVVDTGDDTLAQAFLTISPISKEILLFNLNRDRETVFHRSSQHRTKWKKKTPFYDMSFGGICYGHCIWISMDRTTGNSAKRVLCGFHGTDLKGAGTFYSDDDGLTWGVSNRVNAPNLIADIWQTGAVEPTFVELNDGRVWMLLRTSNDRLYESFSHDRGESWSEAVPSRFEAGPNSWATLNRLTSGKILLVWNNGVSPSPMDTDGKWSFTNRDVIHGAISRDDGKTWMGFRELCLDRLRDSGSFVNEPGDKGLNESQLAETAGGDVLITCGQGKGHRTSLLLNPDWLYSNSHYDDFSEGLGNWSVQKLIRRDPEYSRYFHHNYNRKAGAVLEDHPEISGMRVLHIRRVLDPELFDDRDGAVWNFPASRAGEVETRLMCADGFGGITIALTDRWYQPTDNEGEAAAVFSLTITEKYAIADSVSLQAGAWYNFRFSWNRLGDTSQDTCRVLICRQDDPKADEQIEITLDLRRSCPNGLSYLRFRSTAGMEDQRGAYVEYVSARIGSAVAETGEMIDTIQEQST